MNWFDLIEYLPHNLNEIIEKYTREKMSDDLLYDIRVIGIEYCLRMCFLHIFNKYIINYDNHSVQRRQLDNHSMKIEDIIVYCFTIKDIQNLIYNENNLILKICEEHCYDNDYHFDESLVSYDLRNTQ